MRTKRVATAQVGIEVCVLFLIDGASQSIGAKEPQQVFVPRT
jgi:hypothetical protein